MCGEKQFAVTLYTQKRGSPPRVRGKVDLGYIKKNQYRITPACAGKRRQVRKRRMPEQDHPRVCGEKMSICLYQPQGKGSPPRVRGKGLIFSGRFLMNRITPACAGKRVFHMDSGTVKKDHPRVCGEKRLILCRDFAQIGSPPRVRGKVLQVLFIHAVARITPACAGKRLRNLRKYAVLFSLRVTFPLTSQRFRRSPCSHPQPCAAVQTRSLNAPRPLPN